MLSPWISILKTVFFCRTLYICKLLVIIIVIIKTEEFPQWDVGVKSGQEKALFSSFSYKWGWEKFKINITFLQLWLETKLKSGLKLHPDFGSLFLCDERYTDILTIYFYFIYVFLGTSFWQNKQPLEWTDRLGFFLSGILQNKISLCLDSLRFRCLYKCWHVFSEAKSDF